MQPSQYTCHVRASACRNNSLIWLIVSLYAVSSTCGPRGGGETKRRRTDHVCHGRNDIPRGGGGGGGGGKQKGDELIMLLRSKRLLSHTIYKSVLVDFTC